MNCQKGWILIVLLFFLLSPLNLEAMVSLSNKNLLENIETQSTQDELIIKFIFKKDLKYFQQPIFYKKSIQIDFPNAYSQPAKQFLTTGNAQISQIYVSQFSAQRMRVRFILGKGEKADYDDRFHLQKKDNSLTVRVDLKQVDLLDRLLARASAKTEEKLKAQPKIKASESVENKRTVKEPVRFQVKKAMVNPVGLKNGLSDKIQTASFNKNPRWKDDGDKLENLLKPLAKTSSNIINPDGNKKSKPAGLISSGFKI